MDYEQLQQYQQSLLDRALTEGIKRNDEQTKTWSEYKERHEKVIEGLETFREELSVSCMVPIGKRALMRGKLTHTNEILVSLGEGYFVKYSAAQAIALCNRRIKRANDILESLEKERNLFEMRQKIPNSFDAFGSDERKDFVEHWDNEKLDDWRVQHRQREKEYRKKLAELRSTEKPEIQTEDDLFNKLDALELQEELEDELHRLEATRPDFYTQDLDDGEVYDESESDDDSNTSVTTENESNSDNDERPLEIQEKKSSTANNVQSSLNNEMNSSKSISSNPSSQQTEKKTSKCVRVKLTDSTNDESPLDASSVKVTETETREKKVAFGEPQVKYFSNNDKIEVISQDANIAKAGTSAPSQLTEVKTSDVDDDDDDDDDGSDEDNVIRIKFKHSDYEPKVSKVENDAIESPRDIYRIFSKPKSILKKSPNHVPQYDNYVPPVDYSTDEEIEDIPPGISAYSTIVKEIREHVADASVGNQNETVKQKRPISKFKRERSNMKK